MAKYSYIRATIIDITSGISKRNFITKTKAMVNTHLYTNPLVNGVMAVEGNLDEIFKDDPEGLAEFFIYMSMATLDHEEFVIGTHRFSVRVKSTEPLF